MVDVGGWFINAPLIFGGVVLMTFEMGQTTW
jgi:hypothetical protein